MSYRRTTLVVAIALVAVLPHLASANVGAIVVTGNVKPKARRDIVKAAAETVARDAGWSLADRTALSNKDLDDIITCSTAEEPSACMPRALDLANVTHVLIVSVDDDKEPDGSPVVMLTGRAIIAAQEIVVRDQRYCEECSADVLTKLSGDLASDLIKQLALRVGNTHLTIRSNPPGARIMLDGQAIGATDQTFTTYPGKHALSVDKDGFAVETRTVDAREDSTTEIVVTLKATSPIGIQEHHEPEHHPVRHERGIAPWVVGGVGVVALAAGIAMLAANDRPTDGGQLVPTHTNFKPWGYASLGIGVVSLGAATYLLVRPLPDDSGAPRGIAFGIGGHF
jgi:hypothetical protein